MRFWLGMMEGDEKLVEVVRGFLCLWKVKARLYKDQTVKENAWKEIFRPLSRDYCVKIERYTPERRYCEYILSNVMKPLHKPD